jgi:hypothetical protein
MSKKSNMISKYIKKLILLTSSIVFFLIIGACATPRNVEAHVPSVYGDVKNAKTGAVIPGVWVKLTNSGDNGYAGSTKGTCTQNEPVKSRYEQTDSSGKVRFDGIDPVESVKNDKRLGTMIDTNLDGSNDAEWLPKKNPEYGCKDADGDPHYAFEFTCSSVPYTITVVMPKGWSGSFDTIKGISFNNFGSDVDMGTIYFHPADTTPTPVATATPKPTITATPNGSVSPTPTAAPATPAPGCNGADCSKKEIGELDIFNSYVPTTIVDIGKTYWVRLTVRGKTGMMGSTVSVNELINSTNFKLVEPVYNSDPSFKIMKPNTDPDLADIDSSNTLCADTAPANGVPDCITNKIYSGSNLTGYTINIANVNSGDTYYIYLQATATASTAAGTKIDVDSSSSTITFQTTPASTYPLANTQVSVKATQAFFQVGTGDVYSDATGTSINVNLPFDTEFSRDSKSIIVHQGISAYGQGAAGAPPWDIGNYRHKLMPDIYQDLLNTYKEELVVKNIAGINSFDTSGYYLDKGSIGANKDFTIGGGNWKNQTLTGKQVVLFIPGNLYIEEPFNIANDGKSIITFIVAGNIGINPQIADISGIYMATGTIDTACEKSKGFSGKTCATTNTPVNQLTLRGAYIAKDGFNLDRRGNPGVLPGEVFVFKPEYLISGATTIGKKLYYWKETKD